MPGAVQPAWRCAVRVDGRGATKSALHMPDHTPVVCAARGQPSRHVSNGRLPFPAGVVSAKPESGVTNGPLHVLRRSYGTSTSLLAL